MRYMPTGDHAMAALHALDLIAMVTTMEKEMSRLAAEICTQRTTAVRRVCARSLGGFKPNRNLMKKKESPAP